MTVAVLILLYLGLLFITGPLPRLVGRLVESIVRLFVGDR